FEYEPWQRPELAPYFGAEPLTPLFERYLAAISRQKMRSLPFLVELNRKLAGEIEYLIRMEPGVQTPEETLVKRSGSCRDSGWLLVLLLRHLGLAARFVSGDLLQLTPDVTALDGPSGPKKDFTDLHAWAEVYLPGAGWIGLDPTSGLFAGEGHLPLSCTPEPGSAAPVTGTIDRCEVKFSHEMAVTRIWEAPGSQSLIPMKNGGPSISSATMSMPISPLAMCDSRWVESRRLYLSMIPTAKNGTPRRWDLTSAGSPPISIIVCASATGCRAWSISAKANGIRANSSHAGRSTVSGAPTVSRSGAMSRSLRM